MIAIGNPKNNAATVANLGSVHNWVTKRETLTETVDACIGHCPATGRHSKKTYKLTDFDFEGQLPRHQKTYRGVDEEVLPFSP